jgi:hypothetical protein
VKFREGEKGDRSLDRLRGRQSQAEHKGETNRVEKERGRERERERKREEDKMCRWKERGIYTERERGRER